MNVFDIQPFSLHDGPGIRTTVFLKGCPLSCAWCSNPEGISTKPELSFQKNTCTDCLDCTTVCKVGALIPVDGKLAVKHDKCTTCGDCLSVCPTNALKIVGYQMSAEEIIAKILKDKLYFENSGGGLTLSGGEVTMQSKNVKGLLKLAKKEGIHTCIETCGYVREKGLSELLPYVDLVLFDYKITASDEHEYYTGKSNEIILENLQFLNDQGKKIVLRTPIIPGINDSDQHFAAIAALCKRFKQIERVEMMPYHNWGVHKYEEIGRMPPELDIETPDSEVIDAYLMRLRELGCEQAFKS